MTQLSGEINMQTIMSGDVSSRPTLNVGLTDEVKQALLTIAQKVAYIDEHGQDYYNALYSALYPPAVLLSINAVFAQGNAVIYDSDSLDVLRQYLTVTGLFDDYTTDTIQGYSLSGTLTAGTSTITVSYGGKTATFSVEVTHRIWAVTSIDAVFTQGSAVIYDNDPLDVLREYLVVTATYENSSTAVVTSYSLSGTLTAGTSTITASFGGKSDTFAVSVTQHIAVLVSISAVFTQGDNVIYTTDSLDTLKQYLVVTAHYDDNTDTVVSDYTLSGTLTVGTSTVTVSFGGKTTTFTVTVTATPEPGTDWEDGVPYSFEVIENEYCSIGGIMAYNGWSRTPYLPCRGADSISLNQSLGSGSYSCWFDKDKELITNFSPNQSNLRSVPAEACFVMFSQEDSILRAAMPITPHASEG